MNSTICSNLEQIHNRIQNTCKQIGRDPGELRLIAVSKTKPLSAIEEAIDCGQTAFGENRARELQEKMEQLDEPDVEWHYVGPMQTNKIKYMVPRVDWIHSIYKKKYFDEIEKRAADTGRVINTLIQVNISREDQKQGCKPAHVPQLLEHARSMSHLKVRGLMGMASFTDDRDQIREEFQVLKRTLEENRGQNGGAVMLEHLSMGMTNDLEIAIEEGSTMLRIGTAIFGERNKP